MRRILTVAAVVVAALVAVPAAALSPEPPTDPACDDAVWVVDQEAQPAVPVVQHRDYLWTRLVVVREEVTQTLWKYVQHGGPGVVWVDNDVYKYVTEDGTGTNVKPPKGTTYYSRTQDTKTVVVQPAIKQPEGRWFHAGETPDAEWTWTGLWKLHVIQPYVPATPELGHWQCPDGEPDPEPSEEPTPVPSDEPAEPVDDGDDGTPIPVPAAPAVARVTAPTFTG